MANHTPHHGPSSAAAAAGESRGLPATAGSVLWMSTQPHPPEWLSFAGTAAGWAIIPYEPRQEHAQLALADVVVLDARQDVGTRLVLCDQLRHKLLALGVPVIVLFDQDSSDLRMRALRAGAADCIGPGQSDQECAARVGTLLRLGSLERATRHQADQLRRQGQVLEQKVAEKTRDTVRGRDAIIFGLAKLAENRDDTTGHHLERVCAYSAVLAARIVGNREDVDAEWADVVERTAALHDIGKVGIPDGILLKAGPLTDLERTTMQRHTVIGGDTLNAIRLMWGDNPFIVTAMQIALGHHERWDGRGYPFGMSQENIPLAARIVSVADVYDALTTARPYKTAMSHSDAFEAIVAGAGTQFDPDLVKLTRGCESQFAEIRARFAEQVTPAERP
jgi:response regulator RpfG family c-di-GMP phosphodiesterase